MIRPRSIIVLFLACLCVACSLAPQTPVTMTCWCRPVFTRLMPLMSRRKGWKFSSTIV